MCNIVLKDQRGFFFLQSWKTLFKATDLRKKGTNNTCKQSKIISSNLTLNFELQKFQYKLHCLPGGLLFSTAKKREEGKTSGQMQCKGVINN